mmetsp:Transcript_13745/g.31866  ORF Transcript_13745/g.31866 Transcript_13745/m.31866 type:complete len:206 (+) Transcript_13745:863-1480(+)
MRPSQDRHRSQGHGDGENAAEPDPQQLCRRHAGPLPALRDHERPCLREAQGLQGDEGPQDLRRVLHLRARRTRGTHRRRAQPVRFPLRAQLPARRRVRDARHPYVPVAPEDRARAGGELGAHAEARGAHGGLVARASVKVRGDARGRPWRGHDVQGQRRCLCCWRVPCRAARATVQAGRHQGGDGVHQQPGAHFRLEPQLLSPAG